MITTLNFLKLALPANAPFYAIQTIQHKTKETTQEFVASIDKLVELPQKPGYNAYFSVAGYDAEIRQTTNVIGNKLFVLDIDFKKYVNQQAAQNAVKAFLKETKLLEYAYIVHSGGGFHVYFIIERATRRQHIWKEYADGLVSLANRHKLHIDAGVTTNSHGLIRLPDSINYSYEHKPKATIVREGKVIPIEVLGNGLIPRITEASKEASNYIHPDAVSDAVTRDILGIDEVKFKYLIERSFTGEGCAHIEFARANPNDVDEPLWRGVLSIAKFCQDGATAIHRISKDYEGYSAEETENKAAKIIAPYPCSKFDEVNPGLCSNCKFRGSFGPSGGPVIMARKNFIPIIQAPAQAAEPQPEKPQSEEPSGGSPPTSKYPPEYSFEKGKGITRLVLEEYDENQNPRYKSVPVCDYDFYPVRIVNDQVLGYSVEFHAHMPHGIIGKVAINSSLCGKVNELVSHVASRAGFVNHKYPKAFYQYVWDAHTHFYSKRLPSMAFNELGWNEKKDGIAIGSRLVKKDGVHECIASASMVQIDQQFSKRGELKKWTEIINLFDAPNCKPQAAMVFGGFMVPYMELFELEISGFVLSLFSAGSGRGKSVAVEAVASIYGSKRLVMSGGSTPKSILDRFAMFRNIPVCVDEFTKATGAMKAGLAYNATMGQSRSAMTQTGGRREIHQWKTGLFVTGNNSFIGDIKNDDASSDGPDKRILEFYMEPLTKDDVARCGNKFSELTHHHGLAGEVFLQAMLQRPEYFQTVYNNAVKKVADAIDALAPDRFWVCIGALIIAGGQLSAELGLHNIPIEPVAEMVIDNIIKVKNESNAVFKEATDDFVKEFLSKNLRHLVLPDQSISTTQHTVHGEIMGKINAKDKEVLIIPTALREFCKVKNYNLGTTLDTLKAMGTYLGRKRSRVIAGMEAYNCYAFKYDVDDSQPTNTDSVGEAMQGG